MGVIGYVILAIRVVLVYALVLYNNPVLLKQRNDGGCSWWLV
ncbi:MAG: hypothetical protein ACRETQ_05440 [Gammaproteobacteria bacterium]